MPQFIVKLADKYLFWSTIVDAPVTRGMTLGELHEYVREESGGRGITDLPERMERVERTGTSEREPNATADGTIWLNRAGVGETCLSRSQIIDYYVTRQGEGERPVGVKTSERFSFEQWRALDESRLTVSIGVEGAGGNE